MPLDSPFVNIDLEKVQVLIDQYVFDKIFL